MLLVPFKDSQIDWIKDIRYLGAYIVALTFIPVILTLLHYASNIFCLYIIF